MSIGFTDPHDYSPPSGLSLVAQTPGTGTALVNGALTFCTWNVPNDNNLHTALVVATLVVGSTETGGATGLTYTDPSNTARTNFQILAGAQTAGLHLWGFITTLVYPGTAFQVVQTSALTAGAATMYVAVWGA